MSDVKLNSVFRKIRNLAAIALLSGSLSGVTDQARAQIALPQFIFEFAIPIDVPARPEGIIYGPDGAYWFASYSAANIGRIETVSNTWGFISLLPSTSPFSLVAGPTNTLASTNIFFSESGLNGIGAVNVANSAYGHFALPPPNRAPWTMTLGPDGLIWFVEFNLNMIAAFDPVAVVTNHFITLVHEYGPFPSGNNGSPSSQIYGLTTGSDGKLWFAAATQGIIGTFDTNGSNYAEFQLPNPAVQPTAMTKGPDGAIWFTEFSGDAIGRITTNGTVSEFSVPPGSLSLDGPDSIVAGLDGNLWFTTYFSSTIGRMTTNGDVTTFPTPTGNALLTCIATGVPGQSTNVLDTNIWFGEFNSTGTPNVDDQIGKLIVADAMLVQRSNGFTQTASNTFSGVIGTFETATDTNAIAINWEDGEIDSITINNETPTTINIVVTNTVGSNLVVVTNFLSVSNTVPVTTNGVGTFVITAGHTYFATNLFTAILSVNDTRGDTGYFETNLSTLPAFFAGSVQVSGSTDLLQFPDGTPFGFFSVNSFPYVFHVDIGWLFFFDANAGNGECYLYDFTSGHWWFTTRTDFPFVYDFTLNSWLYYKPNPGSPHHYTSNPRQFFDFNTMTWITQ